MVQTFQRCNGVLEGRLAGGHGRNARTVQWHKGVNGAVCDPLCKIVSCICIKASEQSRVVDYAVERHDV